MEGNLGAAESWEVVNEGRQQVRAAFLLGTKLVRTVAFQVEPHCGSVSPPCAEGDQDWLPGYVQ